MKKLIIILMLSLVVLSGCNEDAQKCMDDCKDGFEEHLGEIECSIIFDGNGTILSREGCDIYYFVIKECEGKCLK